jgi:protein CrcB
MRLTFVLVGIGGMLGALARYGARFALLRLLRPAKPTILAVSPASHSATAPHKAAAHPVSSPVFVAATFAVNLSGAFLLGMLHAIEPAAGTMLFLGDGFLGAYTTFSTFMWEGFALNKDRRQLNAALYIAITLIMGIAAYATAILF